MSAITETVETVEAKVIDPTLFYLPDTNVYIDDLDILNDYKIVVTSLVLRELEKHKSNHRDMALSKAARKASRKILKKIRDGEVAHVDLNDYDGYLDADSDPNYVDNKIIQACIANGYGLITSDVLLMIQADRFNVPYIEVDDHTDYDDYTGVKDILVDPFNMTEDVERYFALRSLGDVAENIFDCKRNEYVVFWDLSKPEYKDGKLAGYRPYQRPARWNGEEYVKLNYRKIGGVKPINIKQEIMFDVLQNKEMTVKTAFGTFGVGKDYVMITHALDMIEDPESPIQKIVWVRNAVELEDSEPIGFLPGEMTSKLSGFFSPLKDHISPEGVEMMMQKGTLEIQQLGALRGRNIEDAIIYCTEIQNSTRNHVKLFLGRVGKGSQLWLNGDVKQADKESFRRNSGLLALKSLAGQELYGQVTLDKIERSETAKLATLLDD